MLDDEKHQTLSLDAQQLSLPDTNGVTTAGHDAADKSKNNAGADSNQSTQSQSQSHSTTTTTTSTTSTSTAAASKATINRSFVKNSRLVSHDTGNRNQSRPERANLSINVSTDNTNTNTAAASNNHTYAAKTAKTYAHPKRVPFDNELVLQNLIRAQIEYLFSDYHLTNDTYLLARMQDNVHHWLSVDELCHNQKIRCLTIKKERVLQALRESVYLELSTDGERVRRPDFTLPKLKPNRDLRRTVFLYGIPVAKTEHDLRKLLAPYGHIKRVHFEPPECDENLSMQESMRGGGQDVDDEAPNREVAQLIMRKKFLFPSRFTGSDRDSDTESNRGGSGGGGGFTPRSATGDFDSDLDAMSMMSGASGMSNLSRRERMSMMHDVYAHPLRNPNGDAQDFSHLKTAFIVFESQSQATKCVKARVRAADGMRCIHKYDYNKVAKKYRTAQMKGEDLTFSPPPPSTGEGRERASSVPGHAGSGWGGDRGDRGDRGESPGIHSHGYGGGTPRGGYQRFGGARGGRGGGRGGGGFNTYRDRSHSMSSTDDVRSGGGGGYNAYQSARAGRNFQRSQTPTSAGSASNAGAANVSSGGAFYGLGGRKNRPSHTSHNEHEHEQHDYVSPSSSSRPQSHRLGSRADRHSHDKSHVRGDGVRKSPGSQQHHSHGQNQNQNKARSYSYGGGPGGDSIPAPNFMMMNAHKQPPPPPQPLQQQQQQALPKPNQMAMTRSHSAHVSSQSPTAAQTPTQAHPQQQQQHQRQQQAQQRMSTPTAGTVEGQQQQSSTSNMPAAPQLYHPIGRDAALPTRQDADALKAAGYQHELYYLNMDDLNIIDDQFLNDPLIAYDAYFGVDPAGNPLSTSVAAKQLQEQQLQMQQQQQRQSQPQQQRHYRGQPQPPPQQQQAFSSASAASSQYHGQTVQQQPPPPSQQRSFLRSTAPPYQHQPQQQPQQQQPQQQQQQSSMYAGARYGYNQTQTQTQAAQQQQQRYGRYQASSSSSSSSNGTSNAQAQAQYNPQQWQLDKLERFKAEKAVQAARKQQQQQQRQQPQQQQSSAGANTSTAQSAGQQQVTALSVMSSSN